MTKLFRCFSCEDEVEKVFERLELVGLEDYFLRTPIADSEPVFWMVCESCYVHGWEQELWLAIEKLE